MNIIAPGAIILKYSSSFSKDIDKDNNEEKVLSLMYETLLKLNISITLILDERMFLNPKYLNSRQGSYEIFSKK